MLTRFEVISLRHMQLVFLHTSIVHFKILNNNKINYLYHDSYMLERVIVIHVVPSAHFPSFEYYSSGCIFVKTYEYLLYSNAISTILWPNPYIYLQNIILPKIQNLDTDLFHNLQMISNILRLICIILYVLTQFCWVVACKYPLNQSSKCPPSIMHLLQDISTSICLVVRVTEFNVAFN